MTMLWSAAGIATATGGTATADFAATGVSIDTRSLRPGDLFVALTAARDGHDFVAEALARGAAGALVARRPEGVSPDAPLVIVPDVQAALEALGRAGRRRSRARVLAVTGSAGKTSTKEMVRSMLGGQGQVHASEASYNNHWGVPLTLARLPVDADFAVIEIGMNHPGEIAPLARMAAPDVALVTTVAAAHLAAFASVQDIAREKAAIIDGLGRGGLAVLPGDIDATALLVDAAERAGIGVRSFATRPGGSETLAWRLLDVRLAEGVTVCRAATPCGPLAFKYASPGLHFAGNALGALAAVHALGGDLAVAAADLGTWRPAPGRGARLVVPLDESDPRQSITLIDDAYNANPASMAAALDMLAAMPVRHGVGRVARGRRIVYAGDMMELGPGSEALHAALAGHKAMPAIDRVHCVGPQSRALHAALPAERRGEWAETATQMARRVGRHLDAGDVVLVKGSRASGLAAVVDAIRNLGHPPPEGGAAGLSLPAAGARPSP